MALNEQEFSTEVRASVAQCFAVITDFGSYPRWYSSIQRIDVLAQYPNGLARRVEYHVDMKLKTVRYVLEYTYKKPTLLSWKSVEGDIEMIQGSYRFEKLAASLTRATCRQGVSLGFWLPGPLRSWIEGQALERSVLEFKAAAEENRV
jgi:ribosome-associated toxin RatA of RatAB toxin-antitoxin module